MPYKDENKLREYQKAYREKNKEKRATYQREYFFDNKSKIKENRKEYLKEYYEKNKKDILDKCRRYQIENKDAISQYRKEYYIRNKEVLQQYNRDYAKKNKDRANARLQKSRKLRSDWIYELKSTLCCIVCGEKDAACLDFHHINPNQKKDLVSKLANQAASWERILEEIEKCDILCSNCHRKHHKTR